MQLDGMSIISPTIMGIAEYFVVTSVGPGIFEMPFLPSKLSLIFPNKLIISEHNKLLIYRIGLTCGLSTIYLLPWKVL